MRLLHTADWHLGKKLEQLDRTAEHDDFLSWLLDQLDSQKIDVLVVAGDIFDTYSPSNTALTQYYSFLKACTQTHCKQVVITGGNHDSPGLLNAPVELLKAFNIYVIGAANEQYNHQLIECKNKRGDVGMVICAVPFLRDRDIRQPIPAELPDERAERVSAGVAAYYKGLADKASAYYQLDIPLVATGHLYAAGVTYEGYEGRRGASEVSVGSLSLLGAGIFPNEFDYVALGHIHRAQIVGGQPRLRYSGSPIPLSFSEADDVKKVVVVQLQPGVAPVIEDLEVPCFRKLIRFKGSLERVSQLLASWNYPPCMRGTWAELTIETDRYLLEVDKYLRTICLQTAIESFFVRQFKKNSVVSSPLPISLNLLTPQEVFDSCYQAAHGQVAPRELVETFKEVLSELI